MNTTDRRIAKVLNLEGRPWYRIEPPAASSPSNAGTKKAVIRLYDAIGGWFGVTAKQFVSELDQLDVDEIELHINSPGGIVWDGVAIRNALRQHPARVVSVVDGIAASAASFIALAADEVVMAPNSELMIHDASAICWGWARDMEKAAQDLHRVSRNIASMYAAKAGGTVEGWRELMLAETWYSAEEAVEAGLADRVDTDEDPAETEQAKNAFDLSSVFAYAGRSAAPPPAALAAPALPAASASGSTSQAAAATGDTTQEGAAVDESQLTTLRQAVGVPEDADADTVIAATLEALEERAESTPAATVSAPEGTVLVSAEVHAQTQARLEQLEARETERQAQARAELVTAAIRDGRITKDERQIWEDALARNGETAQATLSALPANSRIPTDEIGSGEGIAEDDETVALLQKVGWADQKGA